MTDPTGGGSVDEKGLKLSHRTILRMYIEFSRALQASSRIRPGQPEDDLAILIQQPTILAEIKALLWLGFEMAKRIDGGDTHAIVAYLGKHEDEDFQTVSQDVREALVARTETLVNEVGKVLLNGPACGKCGEKTCLGCGKCHDCEEHANLH